MSAAIHYRMLADLAHANNLLTEVAQSASDDAHLSPGLIDKITTHLTAQGYIKPEEAAL